MARLAVVLGGANTLAQDLIDFSELMKGVGLGHVPSVVVATNDAGRDYSGKVNHWVTLHPEKMAAWLEGRNAKGHIPPEGFWTSNTKNLPESIPFRTVPSWNGSSGLLAVTVALHLGFTHVVLCGVPLDKNSAHYFDDKKWMDAPRYRHAWIKHKRDMDDHVRSMSGWTKAILGGPDKEWLNELSG